MKALISELRMIAVGYLLDCILWLLPRTAEADRLVIAINAWALQSVQDLDPIARAKGWAK